MAVFVAVMLGIGRRLIPSVLHYIAHTGSRELFRLGVLAIALGVAYGAAQLFGVSFALGAFFAGMVLAESELSQRAAEESLPLRDAFAVLFFVSVGMLFNPLILIEKAGPVLLTVLIVIIGKSLAALAIVLAFRYSLATALLIAASLAQIGEFSFILAGLGVDLGLLDATGRDLVLASALLSILINPLLFLALDRLDPVIAGKAPVARAPHWTAREQVEPLAAAAKPEGGHVVLVGYGRVGQRIAEQVGMDGAGLVVIDERDDVAAAARAKGIRAIAAGARSALDEAGVAAALALVVAIPDVFEAGQIIEQAHSSNPRLAIIARGHSDAEVEHLIGCGATTVVQGADEIARAMAGQLRLRTGYSRP